MKNKVIILLMFIICVSFVTPSMVYGVSSTHANQANSSSGNSLGDRLKVESSITNYGHPMKVTLYLCKTNDITRDTDGNVASPTDVNISKFVKFGKSVLVGTDNSVGYSNAYINIDTCKIDQLTRQIAPTYATTTLSAYGGLITNLGIPAWGNSECNAADVTAIRNYFTCAGDAKLKNLNDLIRTVSIKFSGKTGFIDAVSYTLNKAKTADFDYVDESGEQLDISVKNILPSYGGKDFVSNWLVVMEPAFTYQQDPYSYFGNKPKTAIMTATDAVLANKGAGLSGSAFKYKFNSGSPSYNAIIKYCSTCDTTWFAYSKSGTPLIATFCPLPCPSVGPYQEKVGVRYPFAISTALRNMSKAWQLSETWLNGYSKACPGGLPAKPSEDSIIMYGGYSLYFLGPKMQPKTTPTPTPPPTPTPTPVTATGNVIAENELIKAVSGTSGNISKISIVKTSVDTTCNGTKQQWIPATIDPKTGKLITEGHYTTVPCGDPKDLAHAKNITPLSLTVQPSWFWNSSMFNELSRLAVLRPNGSFANDSISFTFNATSSFIANDIDNVFGALKNYRFLTSRNSNSNPLQLAAYMSQQNKGFQSFITPYYGSAYPSAYSSPNGFFGGSNINIVTASVLPSSVTAIGSGVFCSGGSSNSLSIPSKFTSSNFKTSTNITIESTISSSAKSSPSLQTQGVYYNIGAPDMGFITRYESQPISFFPAFQMKYDKDNSGQNSSNVWILANGERKFLSYDNVAMEVLESKISLDGPFSRDREDRWVDPDATHLVARTIPTLKSGSAFKIDASGTLLRITVNAHIQDPAFVPESEREALLQKNDQLIDGYDTYVKSVIAKIKGDGVSYYSNLLQANTKDTLNFLPSGNNVVDLSAKTTLRLAAVPTVNTSIFTSASYIDNNETADYSKNRTITVKGQSIPLRRWEDNNIIKSNTVLKNLLVENGGKTKFYNESYEGLVNITRTYLLELQNCSTSYAQVHPALSDWQTPRNYCAHELSFIFNKNVNLIEEGQYGIGLEVRFPSITLGGVTQVPVLCSSAYLLDIKGSVYDNK